MLVTGPAGAGASALVTAWATQWSDAHPDIPVVVHHVEADSDAADHRALVARLVAELAAISGRRTPMTTGTAARRRRRLRCAARSGRRSAHCGDASGGAWSSTASTASTTSTARPTCAGSPTTIPPNVRIFATASGRPPGGHLRTSRVGDRTAIPPLDPDERRDARHPLPRRLREGSRRDAPRVARRRAEHRATPGSSGSCSTSCASTATTSRSANASTELCAAATVDDLLRARAVALRARLRTRPTRPDARRVHARCGRPAVGSPRPSCSPSSDRVTTIRSPRPSGRRCTSPPRTASSSAAVCSAFAHADLRTAIEDRYLPERRRPARGPRRPRPLLRANARSRTGSSTSSAGSRRRRATSTR